MSTFGLKVALPHRSVKTSDKNQLAFDSEDTFLSVPLGRIPSFSGTTSYTFNTNPPAPGSGTSLTTLAIIPHSLGYVPATFVYALVQFDNGGTIIPQGSFYSLPLAVTLALNANQNIIYQTDANNLTIYYSIGVGSGQVNMNTTSFLFKYYIFLNKGL